jgi:hypothetical protein
MESAIQTKTELTVDSILSSNRKTALKDVSFTFKCEQFEVAIEAKAHRLDGKKIISDRYEEMYQSNHGVRAIAKKVGYNNGTLTYFPAVQDEKGKWVADIAATPIPSESVEKFIKDTSTGVIAKKDITTGIWFVKLASNDILPNWLIEETYNIWSDENSDNCLKIYDYLMESKKVGVLKYNPYGTTYNAFLYPQRVSGSHFRLLLATARVKIDKPEIAPTMVIQSALIKAKERERLNQMGVLAAIEEV